MYEYTAELIRVIDGDTVDLEVDQGLEVLRRLRFRLASINTDELHSPDSEKRKRAVEAQAFLENCFVGAVKITIRTYKDKKEKYGRYLADIFVNDDFESVNQKLLDAGLAEPFMVMTEPEIPKRIGRPRK